MIINLQGIERDLTRRIVDFASGLVYGLNGKMDKVADKVYMLTPTDVEVSADEKKRLRPRAVPGVRRCASAPAAEQTRRA